MIKAMKQGSEDCIADGKDFKLGYLKFLNHSMYPRDEEDFEDYEIDVLDCYFGVENLEDYFQDDVGFAGKEMVTTPMGTFDRRRVEIYYLNKGRSTTTSKARHLRFYNNEYESSKMECYWRSDFCNIKDCTDGRYIKKGDLISLP
jgi:hypothetical protein